ncbi:hypothetical protein C2869_10610 [Saccharobesus litoralis]|uniref:HPt domain-containing protein n=1 Tax=Saccharobesus litoralis TaxID=2172099 RepID=A0A2S0VRL8_9ALTE|nr:Hpt domain-containing protein [Saccharobesus litoralis]AWB66856.1 hypothetical protein C2869_10610 [Saccharobesus litoralis]
MVLDKQEALDRLGGNIDLLKMLVTKFVGDYQAIPQDINQFLAAGNTEEALRYVHSIKGAAANLGMHDLMQSAKVCEDNIRANNSLTDSEISELDNAYQAVVSASQQL